MTGQTLISVACSSHIEKGLVEQVSYILDKGADPTIVDIDGFNAVSITEFVGILLKIDSLYCSWSLGS
jgi:hypothetical protein